MPRSYGGSTARGAGGLEVQFKKNRLYIENLKKVIGAVGKKVYGEYIAEALHRAVTETVKDSGRAAANWNISFGSAPMTAGMDPSKYGQAFNEGAGHVGQRGDRKEVRGSKTPPIAQYKGFYYGYRFDEAGTSLIKDGRIHQTLGIGRSGTPPTAFLYNPIYSPELAPYAKNAFLAKFSESSMSGAAAEINAKIPKIVRETAMELRFPLTYKR